MVMAARIPLLAQRASMDWAEFFYFAAEVFRSMPASQGSTSCPVGGKLAVDAAVGGRRWGLPHQALPRGHDVRFHPFVTPVIGNHGHPKPQRLVTLVGGRVTIGIDPVGRWRHLESVLPQQPLVDLELPLVAGVPLFVELRDLGGLRFCSKSGSSVDFRAGVIPETAPQPSAILEE